MVSRISVAIAALPLLVLAVLSTPPVHARIEFPKYDSVLGYEFGDALIPEIVIANPEPVLRHLARNNPPPDPPDESVLPKPSLFQDLWAQSQRWTDALWFSFPRDDYFYPRPTGRWDNLFSDGIQIDVAFHLRRGMTVAEADQVMAGYWEKKTTDLVPGVVRFQSVNQQTDIYFREYSRLVVRFQDGRLSGFGYRSLPRQQHQGYWVD